MTRRLGAVALLILGLLLAVCGPAAADGTASSQGKTHVVCVGASGDSDSAFDGICVWVPLPV